MRNRIIVKLSSIIFFLYFSVPSFGQYVNIPEVDKINTMEDCIKYTKELKEVINWYSETNINMDTALRIEAKSFLIRYIYLNNDFKPILFGNNLMNIESEDKELQNELTFLYILGLFEYYIVNYKINYKAEENGIVKIIDFYNNNKESFSDSAKIENYINLQKENKLSSWIEGNHKQYNYNPNNHYEGNQ